MRTEQEIREKLEKFKKDNPKEWVYSTQNQGLIGSYQATIKELEWVLNEKGEQYEGALKEAFGKVYKLWVFWIANGMNNASDENIQGLLQDLGQATRIFADVIGHQDSTLNYYTKSTEDFIPEMSADDFMYALGQQKGWHSEPLDYEEAMKDGKQALQED